MGDVLPARASIAAMLCAALLLSACQRNAASDAKADADQVFGAVDPDRARPLEPISQEELEEMPLDGDLSCYFAEDPAADPLLYARGFVRSPGTPAAMLVKVGGTVTRGQATEAGGYDAITDGSTFDTAALVVDVARTSDEAASGSGSLTPFPAALRVRQAGQPDRVMHGYWSCGA